LQEISLFLIVEISTARNITSNEFWTSADSTNCPNSFAWCAEGEREYIDFEAFNMSRFENNAKKRCVMAKYVSNKTEIKLENEDCTLRKSVICEEVCSTQNPKTLVANNYIYTKKESVSSCPTWKCPVLAFMAEVSCINLHFQG
jgi:hypothetical protein